MTVSELISALARAAAVGLDDREVLISTGDSPVQPIFEIRDDRGAYIFIRTFDEGTI